MQWQSCQKHLALFFSFFMLLCLIQTWIVGWLSACRKALIIKERMIMKGYVNGQQAEDWLYFSFMNKLIHAKVRHWHHADCIQMESISQSSDGFGIQVLLRSLYRTLLFVYTICFNCCVEIRNSVFPSQYNFLKNIMQN